MLNVYDQKILTLSSLVPLNFKTIKNAHAEAMFDI